MDTGGGNPFAVLTAVVAPAILTNACSVLALGTSNRLARVVDRTRVVARELAALEPSDSHHANWAAQLKGLQVRTRLLVKALRVIYGSLGLFATAALVSVLGSIVTYYGAGILFQLTAGLALLAGAVLTLALANAGTLTFIPGTWLLLYGCAVLSASTVTTADIARLICIMGALFVALGSVTFALPAAAHTLMLGLGFGVLHIIFGILIGRLSHGDGG